MSDYPLLRTSSHASLGAVTVADVIGARAAINEPSLSFEFFPPRDENAALGLWRTFDAVLRADADFVSVTYGAGGTNPENSLEVVDRMAKQIPTIGHLTCVGSSFDSTKEIIKRFEAVGVKSILALRGDSPKDNPEALALGELKTALELVEVIKESTSCEIGVAAFPEGHPESPNLQHDAKILKLKQDAGAKFAITQLFFSADAYFNLLEESEAIGVTVPIIPGLMPIGNAKQVLRMASMSGAAIPAELVERLENADDAESRSIGMAFSIELGRELLAAGAPGLHIFTLNHSEAALELARGSGLVASKQ